MARPDVVAYLRENLKKFPEDVLRRQLASDGVDEKEFKEALLEIKKPPRTKIKAKASGALGRALMAAGLSSVIAAVLVAVFQKPPTPKPTIESSAAGGQSGFVGHYGYVVRLPEGYAAVQSFKDQAKTVEVVHFCRSGTDPTSFLDEGLFGQLGIVRLETRPLPVSDDLEGLEKLTNLITGRAQQRGEKFTVKTLQVSNLRGVQITYEAPFSRVEAFLLGHEALYAFMAGQDDETFRGIVQSLRDARSEI
jgi:hypothetical protein